MASNIINSTLTSIITNSVSPSPSSILYNFTNSISPSPSISPSVFQSQTSSPIPPLFNPCPTHIPLGSNYIIIERDYLYTGGITVLVLFFSSMYYTNWLYAKYDTIRKLYLTSIRTTPNPINNVV